MALASGTRLGPYEILSPLGAGGMGEVYRAKDSRLGRDVAIKVLPETVAGDAERLARFEREARALASLNHPGIVTIFSVEESGGTRFLAMELVEGESLDSVIASGGLPLSRFFDIATPLAEALSAAHERGIVHRDLKPGNVMVTGDGRVKVLDFGLARVEAPDSNLNLTNTPTQSRADLTGAGQVFGTVAYMSPEQARGGRVDARSDVFSLGVVLYQLLTGERPFHGESAVDMISSILRDRPFSVTDLRADSPPHLSRILRRCLEKDPRDRYQTSRDVYNELKELRAEASSDFGTSAPSPRPESGLPLRPPSGSVRTEESLWIAVLPFKYGGADTSLTALAEGLSDEIGTGLSRFRYLSVVASASAARSQKVAEGDERAQAARLGARYVLEGSLRGGGSAVRVSAQLVDAQTGARLWSETFSRDLQASSAFEVQDDVAARIVSTVADSYGVLVHSIRSATRQKDDAKLTPVEWQFQFFAYLEQITPAAHAELKARLERAVERDSRQSDLWACLAQLHVDAYSFGFEGDASSLDRALAAARRAVELDRANQFALVALAQTHFFRQDLAAFGPAAERAMALNPLNTDAIGILGLQIVHTGEFERGTAIVRRAMELNPNHAGWMHFAPLWEHFHKGEYEQALERANRVDVPGLFWPYLVMASACGHLGRRAEAAAAVRDLLALDPEFAAHARSNVGTWHFASGLMDPILEGLRKAGLSIPATDGTVTAKADRAVSGTPSGQVRAEEGFWIAVLPFKYGGPDASLTALAEGLTEEIVTGLSRFSYLRVISRSSAADAQSARSQLGARYVMEGSLRQAAAKVRLTVQLVDAISGAHIWAENYERAFSPETAFELQDDLVPRIVSTVADQYGALVHSMSESLRGKGVGEYSAHEAVLRTFGYWERMTREEHAEVRDILEAAVASAPGHSELLTELSQIYCHEYAFGYNPRPDPFGRARDAAQRAIAAAPSNHLAHFALASALFFQKDPLAFRAAADRALALNRMDSSSSALLGTMIAYTGDWEYGVGLVRRAMQLNPHHPGWYQYAIATEAYRRRDYRGALASALKINMPGYHWPPATRAAVYGQLGEQERAREALRELLTILPNFGAIAREEYGKWHDLELVEHWLDGLRKAGLDLPALGQSSAAPKPAAAVSIAVLPFSDMSPAKDQEYLCEGMAEEIMNALTRVAGIRVASRTSAFRAQKDGGDLTAIARALSVGHVLEGSVRTSGNRLRVTAQLTDAASGYQLWSERFDREAADIFAVQDEIAAGVVDAVKARLAPGVHTVQARPQARNLDAYRAYLKARHLRGKEHLDGALRAFEESVRLDPTYAPSWTGLAEVTVLASVFGVIPAREACKTAREALATATRLQGESADSLHVEGFVAWIERRWVEMEAAWRRALELQPDHVLTLASFGIVLCTRQRVDEALSLLERAREADPLSSFPYALTGGGLLSCGRPQEALGYLEDALSFARDDATALDNAGIARVALGRVDEGIATLEHVVAVSHRAAHFLGTLGWALAIAGRKDEARAILEELRARPPGSPAVVSEAWLLGALGEIDAAFEVIARADEERHAYLYFTGVPAFDPLRSDPRFAALERRLGLSPA